MDHSSNLVGRIAFLKSDRFSSLALVGLCLAVGVVVGLTSALVNPLILLASVPILVVAIWVLQNDERSLWLLIAVIGILPRFAAPIKLGVTPTFLDLALVLLIVAWLLHAGDHPLRIRKMPIALPLFGLIIVAIATFVVGLPNGALTPLILRRFTEMVISLTLVYVLVSMMCTRDILVRVMRVLILVGALAALIGIVLYVLPSELSIRLLSALAPFGYPTGPTVLHYINDDPALTQRATGLWIDPNAFGGLLLICGSLTLPQLFSRERLLPLKVIFVSLGLICLALILTVSRGAMLGLLFVAVVFGVVRYRRLLALGVIAVALVLLLPQTHDLVAHFATGFAGQDLATQMRFGEYKDALRLIGRYPLLGVGFTNAPDIDLYIGVSSMYLLVAQQMGLLGLTAFVATIITLFTSALRSRKQIWPDEMLSAIWLGALGAIVGALVSGIFDHYFFNIDFHNSVMLLWLVIALAVSTQIVGDPCYNQALWKSA
jgi:O-antigen ligase